MIPLNECIHGHVYRIHSRNLDYGVFKSNIGGFTGIREKFGDHYLFTEYHYDTGAPYGTVHPLEDLGPCLLSDISEGRSRDGRWHDNKELFEYLIRFEDQSKELDNGS